MAENTKIEWTDATWSPTVGCSVVSPGCTNCYAMKLAARLGRMGVAKYAGLTEPSKAGPVWNGVVRLDDKALSLPLRWRKPRRIFVNSMSDLFHEALPDEVIDKVFAVMALAPQHTFQVLTKRAQRMRDYMLNASRELRVLLAAKLDPATHDDIWPLPNLWLGVSVERQQEADERIPALLDTPAAVRFLSCEPLLGPIDLTSISYGGNMRDTSDCLDWVIVGGESGPNARPFDLAWARSIVAQCRNAGTACFVKQLGSNPTLHGYRESVMPLNDRKGGDISEFPEDLRVREFPR